jgi:hypothetical protein
MQDDNITAGVGVYCHICSAEVLGQTNADSREMECTQCGSNFVELTGQGMDLFNSGQSAPLPCRRPAGHGRTNVERRVRHPTEERNRTGTPGAQLSDLLGRQTSEENGGRSVGVFVSSSMIRNFNLQLPLSFADGDPTRNGGIMSAFMGIRGNSEMGGGFLGGIGGGGRSFEDLLHHLMMNGDSSHQGVPPASEKIIESLTRLTVTEDTNLRELGECCISQEPFEPGEVAVCLPCEHSYKEEPIVQWLKMHNQCPVCRAELPTPDVMPELVDITANDIN